MSNKKACSYFEKVKKFSRNSKTLLIKYLRTYYTCIHSINYIYLVDISNIYSIDKIGNENFNNSISF